MGKRFCYSFILGYGGNVFSLGGERFRKFLIDIFFRVVFFLVFGDLDKKVVVLVGEGGSG